MCLPRLLSGAHCASPGSGEANLVLPATGVMGFLPEPYCRGFSSNPNGARCYLTPLALLAQCWFGTNGENTENPHWAYLSTSPFPRNHHKQRYRANEHNRLSSPHQRALWETSFGSGCRAPASNHLCHNVPYRRLYFLRRLLPMACGAWGKPAVPRSTLPAGGSWVLTAGPGTPLQRTGGLSAELATGLGLGICFFSPSQDLLGLGGCFFIFP